MRVFVKRISILFAIFFCVQAQAGALSQLLTKRFEQVKDRVCIEVYEGTYKEDFFLPHSSLLAGVKALQEQVGRKTNTDSFFLIQRQKDLFKRVGMLNYMPKFAKALQQSFFEISYLEQMLFERHQEHLGVPLLKSYSEFGAYILRGPLNQIAIIFISNPHEAMVPRFQIAKKYLDEYLAHGFEYSVFIHNHPFNFQNPDDIGGTPVPSGNRDFGDVSAFIWDRNYHGLKSAWITNGFQTIRIPSDEFEDYSYVD